MGTNKGRVVNNLVIEPEVNYLVSKSSNFNTKGNSCSERRKDSLVRVRVRVRLGLVIGHIAKLQSWP